MSAKDTEDLKIQGNAIKLHPRTNEKNERKLEDTKDTKETKEFKEEKVRYELILKELRSIMPINYFTFKVQQKTNEADPKIKNIMEEKCCA